MVVGVQVHSEYLGATAQQIAVTWLAFNLRATTALFQLLLYDFASDSESEPHIADVEHISVKYAQEAIYPPPT